MEPIVRTVSSIIAGVCMGQSLFRLFPTRPSRLKQALVCLLLGIAIVLPGWVGDENPILFFPFFVLGLLLLLPGEKLPKLILAGIFYALLMPMNMLLDSQHWEDAMNMFTIVCKALVWCVLAWLLYRASPTGGLRLSRRLWLLLGGLTLSPLMAMLSFSIWGNNFQTDADYLFYSTMLQRLSITILPFVTVSALALLLAAVVLSRHETLEQESKLTALREVYYTGLKQEHTGLRTLRHDLHNHVTALQGLLEQGRQEEARSYLQKMTDSPAFSGGRRYCENDAANVVLLSKAARMEAAGLLPDFEVSLPADLTIPAPELCALLGNALDNAIEGVADAKEKAVTLRARLEHGMFMLQVQNQTGHAVNGDLSTTKGDTAHHGLGLVSMREIALRHGGSMEAAAKDGRFELIVCFPCGQV